MRFPQWQRVLRAYRKVRHGRVHPEHAKLMFVACSESAASTALIGAFPTAYVLQNMAGAPRELDALTRMTLEYGVLGQGVRHIVVCGHDGCRGCDRNSELKESRDWAIERCHAMEADENVGEMLRRAGVTMQTLWLDEHSQDVHAFSLNGLRTERMSEAELVAMFRTFDKVST